jgi:long-chain acyl-CoA synthetase
MTECSPGTHCNPINGLRKIGAIGVPLPNTDSRIVDPEDGVTDMPVGTEGEMIVRGPQIMRGYWQREDATASTIRDDWLYTGDLAVMDEDGFFRIVGRKKDMILASGYNIYPDEIDRVLSDHAAVFEACTIGIPDPKRGETVKSFVVLNPGTSATEAELTEHCKENLAAYKVPRAIEFRDELPKSSMMKLLRRELRAEELKKQGIEE